MSIFEELRVDSHPLKSFFKQHGIKQFQVAKHIGISHPELSRILNGHIEAAPEIEQKLQELQDKIKAELS